MSAFLDTTPIAITTLSPVHIGCGEDIDPTQYLIEDGVLYQFDPVQAGLPGNLRKDLMAVLNAGKNDLIPQLQRFFQTNGEHFKAATVRGMPVASGVAKTYDSRVGKVAQREAQGRNVANKLEIERTAFNPYSQLPLLPGSSIKGAIRTAILDACNRGAPLQRDPTGRDEKNSALQTRLLGGSFATDPLRLLKIGDAHADAGISQQVVFAVNRKKRQVIKDGREIEGQGPAKMLESVSGGQYRQLHGAISLQHLDRHQPRLTPAPDKRIEDFSEIAIACNRYYLPRLRQSLQLLASRNFANPDWIARLQKLLDGELGAALQANRAFLLKLGRHSGAEALTLDGVRAIRIPQHKHLPPQQASFTVWLAADDNSARSDMLPFGWVLVEPSGNPALPQLQQWCATQHKAGSMASVREKIAAQREQLQARRAAEQQAQAEAAARAEAEAEAQAAAEQARAAMSEAGRATADFLAKWDAAPNKGPGQPAFVALCEILAQACSGNGWSADEQKALAAELGPRIKAVALGKREKEIKAQLRQLRGESA